jgi:hypothetical protein
VAVEVHLLEAPVEVLAVSNEKLLIQPRVSRVKKKLPPERKRLSKLVAKKH